MIIGIEGVSCTGKTTLSAQLAQRLHNPLVIPCYYHCAADPSQLPAPSATTADEQMAALAAFLDIEARRRRLAIQAHDQGRDVILDRTVDTLLAHSHAVGRLRGFDTDAAGRALVLASSIVVPDLTVLLHAPAEVIEQRAARRTAMPRIFYAPPFAAGFNAYFSGPISPTVIRFDSAGGLDDLTSAVAEQAERLRARVAQGQAPAAVEATT
ncbi:dTMP kinase [Micromonospora sp. Llam0]|uniref:AAA family ATPase n=1 Tax=Micromonospora sp. Llam0 TaxID=2485143 RepID=UPI000FAD6A04|nr:AAA family ATPase [Micromonospora sp. Llam0]ROO62891.1 dTMP kinase [Micromonospora sp. Llam0]